MTKYDLSKVNSPQTNPLEQWETVARLVLANSSNNKVSSCVVCVEGNTPYLSVYFSNSSTNYTYKTPHSICSLLDASGAAWWSSLPF